MNLWWKLKPELDEYDRDQLSIAWGHHNIHLGRGELDYIEAGILCRWNQPHSSLWNPCKNPEHTTATRSLRG